MKTLLVTGVSGFLGWHICQFCKREWKVYGTYCSKPVNSQGLNIINIDLTNFRELKQIFQAVKPDAVIHTAAQSNPNFCQVHPQETEAINVTVSGDIAGLCADYGIPCVFTSTDLVFNGINPPYRETDPVSPISYYGEQKVRAETLMLTRYPQTAICRMPLMFGQATPTANSFIQPFMETLQAGKELRLFIDEFRTPVSANTAAQGLLLALDQVQGYLHLGGKERISRYEFGCLLVDVLQLPKTGLNTCHQADVAMPAPRPPDVSLDSSKAFALGYNPLSLREELEALIVGAQALRP